MTPEEIAAQEAAAAAKKAADEEAAKKAADEAAAAKKKADDDAAEAAKKKSGMTDSEAKLLKENMGMKQALADAKKAADDARAALAAYDGLDATEIKKLKKAADDAAEQELVRKGEWDALKKQMNDAHAVELGKKDEAIKAKNDENKTLTEQINELTIGNQFGNSKFIADELSLTPGKTRALYGPHFDYVDGKVVGYDKPKGAKGRVMLVDGQGEPLPFDAALTKIIDGDPDKDSITKSKMKPGAGSRTANTDAKGGAGDEVPLTSKEKIQLGLKKRAEEAAKKK